MIRIVSCVTGDHPWVPRVPGPPAPPPGSRSRVPGRPRRRLGRGVKRPCSSRPILPLDEILIGDCIAALERLPPESVDVVFADPPYNLQLESALTRPDQSLVDAVDDDWDKFASFSDYDAFTRAWLLAVRRVMKKNATLWVIGSYHNIFRVGATLQDLEFWILNDIVWRKANPMPNFRGRRFTNAHETLIWASKGADAKGYTFHYEALKAGNEDLQMRSDWFIPLCTGEERLKGEDGRKVHPTQKPEVAPRAHPPRLVQSRRRRARSLLRHRARPARWRRSSVATSSASSAIRGYASAARERIAAVQPLSEASVAAPPEKRAEARVPFLALLEGGHVKAGETLVDERRRHRAIVRADGTLALGQHRRLDPQDRRSRPGPPGLQRLDVLARGARQDPRLHRRLPREGAGRNDRLSRGFASAPVAASAPSS